MTPALDRIVKLMNEAGYSIVDMDVVAGAAVFKGRRPMNPVDDTEFVLVIVGSVPASIRAQRDELIQAYDN